jgi:hypothetical protein
MQSCFDLRYIMRLIVKAPLIQHRTLPEIRLLRAPLDGLGEGLSPEFVAVGEFPPFPTCLTSAIPLPSSLVTT